MMQLNKRQVWLHDFDIEDILKLFNSLQNTILRRNQDSYLFILNKLLDVMLGFLYILTCAHIDGQMFMNIKLSLGSACRQNGQFHNCQS